MLNIIWLAMILISLVVGVIEDHLSEVVKAVTDSATLGFQLALGLAGIMTLWLGMLSVATESGLVIKLGTLLRPILKRLFPEVPNNHPAMGAIVMNIAANMLGLANAATPFGLKAMQELQSLNQDARIATNSMCTFLAINTSSVQIIPATAMAYLAANGSSNPCSIILSSVLATTISTVIAIVAVRQLAKWPCFKVNGVSSL